MSELVKALAAALPLVEGAIRDAANPHLNKKYADLGSVIAAIRPVTEHGIWFRQQNVQAHGAAVETFYVHTSGEEKSAGIIEVPVNKNDAQGYGSALTYARRYGLMAAFGIAPEDDDGHAAAAAKPKPAPAKPANDPPADRETAVMEWKNKQMAKLEAWGKAAKADQIHAWPDNPSVAEALGKMKADFPTAYASLIQFWKDTSANLRAAG